MHTTDVHFSSIYKFEARVVGVHAHQLVLPLDFQYIISMFMNFLKSNGHSIIPTTAEVYLHLSWWSSQQQSNILLLEKGPGSSEVIETTLYTRMIAVQLTQSSTAIWCAGRGCNYNLSTWSVQCNFTREEGRDYWPGCRCSQSLRFMVEVSSGGCNCYNTSLSPYRLQTSLHRPIHMPPSMAGCFGTLECCLRSCICALAVPRFQKLYNRLW